MKTKNILVTLAVVVSFLILSGCYGGMYGARKKPVHPLNIRTSESGFINADRQPKNTYLVRPTELTIISEYPGSKGGIPVRRFTASLMKLQSLKDMDPQEIERNKIVLEIHNPERIPGLPYVIEPNTIAALVFVGQYVERFADWVPDTIAPNVNTFRLVIHTQGYVSNGGIYNNDWTCSAVTSTEILRVLDPEQRIRGKTMGY